jgi:hypothetical protein
MKNRDIMDAMNGIDFDMIEDAGRVTRKASMRRKITRWSSLAACICLVLVGVAMIFKPDVSQNCEAFGYFSNLDDFYTFATTGSRDASQYTDPYTAREVHRYDGVDASALIKIDEILKDKLLIEELIEVQVTAKNEYAYVFKSGMVVRIKHRGWFASMIDKAKADAIFIREETKYVIESETDRFSVDAPIDSVYVKEIDGIHISRQKKESYKTEYFHFTTRIDSFEIRIAAYWADGYSSLEEWMNNPKNQSIMDFFDDERLPDAIANLKAAIESSKGRK